MTNLEYYKDKFIEMIGSEDIDFCCYFNELYKLGCDSCPCGDKYSPHCNASKFYDWLLEEHKEPIKLKKWEKDLLMVFYNFTDSVKLTLDNAIIISLMLRAGYFQGVPDTSMTIKEILDNCEVTND